MRDDAASPAVRQAATALYEAANQYSAVAAAIALRHATIEMLRDRQAALQEAALAYAAARGWVPAASPPPPPARQ